ncbi:MAG: MarR family transcriptional regulator [Mycobacterium sp.]|jgi:DNA-binding MarR family transcriptional regulator|nr:MarR family transcriptional regulator [Mycobacterium sp.]MCW2744002.1 MarR family transcriptional regulator [Mycobacterium sp.]
MPADATVVDDILRELSLFARRVRALAHRLHPELSFVGYTLLAHVSATGGCLAGELASLYGLDKSTVSRQVGDLERRGLVVRETGPARLLRITPEGGAVLAAAAARQQQALRERVADWSEEDLATFARLLRRYNATFG